MTNLDQINELDFVDESGRGTEEFTHVVQGLFEQQQIETRGIYTGVLPEDAPDGIYLTPERIEGNSSLPNIVHMRLLSDEFRLGSAASHHEVFFGSVLVEREDQELSSVNVAVKAFTTAEKACKEHDALLATAKKGLATLEPLAIVKVGDRTTLITRKRDDLLTRDNVKWTVPYEADGPTGYEATIVPELKFIAESMAEMHVRGVFHGDAQAKNFALSDTGENVVIDLEDAVISENDQETIDLYMGWGSVKEGFAYKDLFHCWRALTNPMAGDNIDIGEDSSPPNTLLLESPGEVVLAEFERSYLVPYLEYVEQNASAEVRLGIDTTELARSIRNRVGEDLIPGYQEDAA